MSEIPRDPHKAVDYILANKKRAAQAKSDRAYLEEFRKSKKALLMKASGEATIGAQEREAYAHPEYLELIAGIREAMKIEEEMRWDMIGAQMRVEIWRTEQANYRAEGKITL